MIKTKNDLLRYISKDSQMLFNQNRKQHELYMKKCKDPRYLISVYLMYLRKEEYYLNQENKSYYTKLMARIYERKRNLLGKNLGFCMEPNCIEEGLNIYHCGCIVINPLARIGKNCQMHGNNCIGNNGITDKCPQIGDNVDIGFGAVIIGDIEIADDIKIGANAVVNKSFLEKGITIAGVPACCVK